jgi:para-aminobenzoate synthetase/4-amino-4-deoxychorismate lyase
VQLRFDFADANGVVAPLRFTSPSRVIVARDIADVSAAMRDVDESLCAGKWVAGFVAYEAAAGFDAALVTQSSTDLPLVWFGVFDAPQSAPPLVAGARPSQPEWGSVISRADHQLGVAAIRAAIADGDTYQINYTFRLRSSIEPSAIAPLYAALARAERVPYGALLELGDWSLLSLSPELFFRADLKTGRIVTQPMKGTAPRGLWLEDDEARVQQLAHSEKNRAENVMIVDLARNDVTRVAEIGSVRATSLFDVDRYPSVLQMVSTVEGRLRDTTPLSEIFRALFPAGSITGAPKSSSMKLIAELEHAPRGAYCGAIGFAAPAGEAVFNVAIRTVTARADGRAEYGVGGGITWDSEAGDEYAEALSKAGCLVVRPEFDLLETLRLENGNAVRLEKHLDRLAQSAIYFGFVADLDRVRAAVVSEANQHPQGRRRMRILVSQPGGVTVESRELEAASATPRIMELAVSPVDRNDRFLYHKTTARSVYERHAALRPDAFDVLLWNEARELTEFTRGNLVVELDGRRVTPPRECGLLKGIFRNELVERGEVLENVVRVDDLGRAARIWFVNSLREWVEVELRRYT